MKLLFDQNLSPRLVDLVSDLFAGSLHVQTVGLSQANDEAVWHHAHTNGFVIVTKDSDFQERSQVTGSGPCVPHHHKVPLTLKPDFLPINWSG